MKQIVVFTALYILISLQINAQVFIDKATIEYEVKSNIKKTMGNSEWAETMAEKLPTFKIGYYNFTFANNKSIYKFDRWMDKEKLPEYMRTDDKNRWYTDFNTGKMNVEKEFYGSTFNLDDSIIKMEWRITDETRNIAGFNCKKAVAKIFDSVYVFAFYTDEIMISGGPNSLNGLPGMIMGVTIPRLFTSWIATKVSVNAVAVNDIKPIAAKKYYSNKTLRTFIVDRTKDWWSGDDTTDEQLQQKNRFVWGMLL